MKPHEINKLNNFIAGWYSSDASICDKIIEHHKNSKKKYPGTSTGGVDKTKKDSTDLQLEKLLLKEYTTFLLKSTDEYVKHYPMSNYYAPWGITSEILVQHYKPGGGYFAWHTERDGIIPKISNRHLVFMTYLNDVTDGGETEFLHQKLKIKPEKGLTLIWPTDWTFTHRGLTSPTQDKYVITGWFNLLPDVLK